jgi:hypothetical protein
MTTLDLCACKRGFFTLRDCGKPATTSCQLCSRRVCDEHLAPRVDTRVCVECAAKQEEGQAPQAAAQAGAQGTAAQQAAASQRQAQSALGQPAVDDEDAILARDYPYRYRRRYYSTWDYYPWWWGTYDPYYNDWGYRYFDDDDGDDDGGGFGDS